MLSSCPMARYLSKINTMITPNLTITSADKRSRGFTLIEIIVSLAIFSIVATVALGALVKIISTNKKAQSLQSSLTNLSFGLESMSRELRAGTRYQPITNGIIFDSTKKDPLSPSCSLKYSYRFSGTGPYELQKAEQTSCSSIIVESDYASILSPNITLTGYRFDVNAGTYPLIAIYLSGYAGIRERERTYFEVQTAVSPIIPE